MRPDFTDQAHRDPSLGRLRPRSIARMRVVPPDGEGYLVEDQLVVPDPVRPTPSVPAWVRRVDRILALILVFAAAVWFVSRLIANATCGV